MAKHKIISIQGVQIRFYEEKEEDFISLTDIAKKFNDRTDQIISNWLRTRNTVDFLGTWELFHNIDFNPLKFEGIRNQTGAPTFVLSVSDWVKSTNAIGIKAKAGRYGGTYAHKDIAFEFLSYLNPAFKLRVIKEFQRLKADEAQRLDTDWNVKRLLSKANWHIHTEAVREYLVPMIDWNTKREAIFQASEADLLNLALFGRTAREWQQANPEKKGNLRDYASTEQLLVLANLQALNAKLIEWDSPKEQRVEILHKTAQEQMQILLRSRAIGDMKKLEEIGKKSDSPLKLK